ncbi:MAG: F0F1 ATP synthase subunit gamma [Dysgonamonadaceae bacterium]|jgi:F-type H+-transporting ATPase subunit gamma|nr:F0F1 ATP synthase subunit gamma [Dysgonamonadaceae bacterium]
MASLKEIKGRINSVKSTQKITSAMKMVSSAKLRVAQNRIENFLPYQQHLTSIMSNFLSSETDYISPLSIKREVNAVAIVVISSNSSLCGAFNSNIIKLLNQTIKDYPHIPKEKIYIYPIGKKVEDTIKKNGGIVQGSFIQLMDKPKFDDAKNIADNLIADFLSKKIDKVELLYNHFKNTASQVSTREQFLPIELTSQQNTKTISTDYIVEPDKITILEALIPKSLRIKLYAGILDSAAAEQAARTVAMQIATENANEILSDLTIQYNKQRQQAITSELLDIIGGSEALK